MSLRPGYVEKAFAVGWKFVAMAVGLHLTALPTHPTRVVTVGVEQMTDRAETIFVGTCMEAQPEADTAHGIVVTRYTFEVTHRIKGVAGGRVTFLQYGGKVGKSRSSIEGLPGYRPGEEVVLFLKPAGAWGLTSPVGVFQGRFQVLREAGSGRKQIQADAFAPHLSGEVMANSARALSKPARVSPEGRMDLDDFVGLIEGMVKDGR